MAIYATVAAFLGGKKKWPEVVESARNAIFVVGGLVSVAGLALLHSLVSQDFQLKYVAEHTNRALPLAYRVSAFWAGQEGSLLLWAWLLAGMAVAVVVQNRRRNRLLLPYVMAVLMGTEAFFLVLLIFTSNPFTRLLAPPPDGQGLNPLLQNVGMLFHPLTTYLGYVGFTVPFAFAVAALITGRLDAAWIHTTRRWTLFSWLFLSIGIVTGAKWAYVELGWGGYWAWDPVENASLMPWLTGTAFLHSVIIQERRGMLKVWNMVLILLTFSLTILGTFITRSGIIQSVHAFGVSTLGPYFLAFLGFSTLGFLTLLFERWPQLRSDHTLESLLSREANFLLNNLLLTGGAFAVLWGTLLPLFAQLFMGQQVAASAPYFNQVAGPVFLAVVFLLAVCPLLAWRRTSIRGLVHQLRWPGIAGLAGTVILFILGLRKPLALLGFAICIGGLATIGLEFWNGVWARRKIRGEAWWVSLWKLLRRQPRRYGGYLVHLGILLMVMGIVGSSFYQTETMASLKPGESMNVGPYRLEYVELGSVPARTHQKVIAILKVYRDGRLIDVLAPEKDYYPNWPEPTTEVAIHSTLREDLYVALTYWEGESQLASFKAIINPLVAWIWIGWVVLIVGTLVAVMPVPRRVLVERRRSHPLVESVPPGA